MMLGYCYECKIATDIDKQKVLELYQKSANLGSSKAQHILASMFNNGKGIARDMVQAIYCEEEHMDGMTMLGFCYSKGIGTNVDKTNGI